MYLGATVVLLGEVLKLLISLALSAHEAGSLGAVGRELYAERAQSWKYAVPALVYTLQNNPRSSRSPTCRRRRTRSRRSSRSR